MSATTIDVGNEQQLNQAIASADAATSGSFDIVFTAATIAEGTDTGQTITFGTQTLMAPPDLYAVNLHSGVSLTIDGGGNTLDGTGLYRGLFVYAGNLTIQNLTIDNAVAQGGAGGPGLGGGGGGAGLGGGLFVAGTSNVVGGSTLASGGNVTLDAVSFLSDGAIGGAGGDGGNPLFDNGGGGGGGLGGSGFFSSPPDMAAEGGGGIGVQAVAGNNLNFAGPGIVLGAAGGGASVGNIITETGGSAGGGGGAADNGGGGGGVGGATGAGVTGGAGGFGGGGGGGFNSHGGNTLEPGGIGGFGGGGGGGASGGFGGGGGGGGGGFGATGASGTGGFGAGAGGSGSISGPGGGGGGLGAGGDVFVQQGGVLTIEGGTLAGGSVQGGGGGMPNGGATGATGAAFGSGIFLQGNQAITLSPPSGQVLIIQDAITDQSAVGGTGVTAGAGTLVIGGTGQVALFAANSYTGGTTLEAGADLQVGDGTIGSISGPVAFPTNPATLVLDGTQAIDALGSISGFRPGSEIALVGETFSTANLSFNSASEQLTIDAGVGGTFTLDFAGLGPSAFEAIPFTGGTVIERVPCFAAGTRIRTARGEVAVEELREGDLAITAAGTAKPIVWMGRARVDCRRHAKPDDVIPVHIHPGAFAPGVPARDLVLSPGHAIFAEGVLIPVRHVVNTVSVCRDDAAAEITYYHVELPEHDVLLAEGLAAESYLDDGNRAAFENGAGARMLHPDFTVRNWENACAPKRENGPEVATVKRRLRERLEDAGWTIAAGEFELWAGRRRLKPKFARGRLYHFRLPAGVAEVRVHSSRGMPAAVFDESGDDRWLGVQVAMVLLDGELIPLDSPVLADGFDRVEQDASGSWRWTDGDAMLVLPASQEPRLLEVYVRDMMRHWVRPLRSVDRVA